MLSLGLPQRIFLYRNVTDMRKSFDTLAGIVRTALAANPMSGDAYVFVGKHRNRVKILLWDRSGYWILAKRLSSGHFGVNGKWRAGGDDKQVELSAAELQLLLDGVELRDAIYRPQYQAPATGR